MYQTNISTVKKILVIAIVITTIMCCLSIEASSENVSDSVIADTSLYGELKLFSDVVTVIQSSYVREATPQELIYGAINGMLVGLDSYSQFMSPDIYKEMQVETKGEFGGIGIVIGIRNGLLIIISPITDTPGDRAGLKSGDVITEINGKSAQKLTLMEAVKKLRGQKGTKVSIGIAREGEKELLHFDIVREVIEIKNIENAGVLDDNVGYVRIVHFNQKVIHELKEEISSLLGKKIDGLIVDVRSNPGGLLGACVKVTDLFLPKGKLIVSTKGRKEGQNITFVSQTGALYPMDMPLVVLINEGSASASEIFAGAIQDWHRGIILGTKSFGKGSVQTVIPLSDGSGIRLTTAKYYTPKGRCIDEVGLIPDVTLEMTKEEKVELFEARIKAIENKDKAKYSILTGDKQLQSAVRIIKAARIIRQNLKSK
ncbi:MAG: S41 family peptidase [bacterium]|nr:S41 family peptidase [bacterium]